MIENNRLTEEELREMVVLAKWASGYEVKFNDELGLVLPSGDSHPCLWWPHTDWQFMKAARSFIPRALREIEELREERLTMADYEQSVSDRDGTISWQSDCIDQLRAQVEELRETYREKEPCGHTKNFLIGDEHGHFTCTVCRIKEFGDRIAELHEETDTWKEMFERQGAEVEELQKDKERLTDTLRNKKAWLVYWKDRTISQHSYDREGRITNSWAACPIPDWDVKQKLDDIDAAMQKEGQS